MYVHTYTHAICLQIYYVYIHTEYIYICICIYMYTLIKYICSPNGHLKNLATVWLHHFCKLTIFVRYCCVTIFPIVLQCATHIFCLSVSVVWSLGIAWVCVFRVTQGCDHQVVWGCDPIWRLIGEDSVPGTLLWLLEGFCQPPLVPCHLDFSGELLTAWQQARERAIETKAIIFLLRNHRNNIPSISCIAFIWSKPLDVAWTQGKEITQGHEYQEAGITGSNVRTACHTNLSWLAHQVVCITVKFFWYIMGIDK